MFTWFYDGGVFMLPLLILSITVLTLTSKKIIELYGKKELDFTRLEVGLNAIIFWGGLSVVIGFLGSFLGIYIAAGHIPATADDISASIVWGGIRVALTTTIFGLIIFAFASIAWFILRSQLKKLMRNTV
ncbi:MAG: MotA/TolQ/ExbB proton channel family protein [bacterium]